LPFKSKAQRRKFYADPRLRKHIPEWETTKKLPERLHTPEKRTKRGRRKEALRRLSGKG
jgi:hypothetical protein